TLGRLPDRGPSPEMDWACAEPPTPFYRVGPPRAMGRDLGWRGLGPLAAETTAQCTRWILSVRLRSPGTPDRFFARVLAAENALVFPASNPLVQLPGAKHDLRMGKLPVIEEEQQCFGDPFCGSAFGMAPRLLQEQVDAHLPIQPGTSTSQLHDCGAGS